MLSFAQRCLNLTRRETLHRHYCTYLTGPSNKIFIRTLFAFNSCDVFLLNELIYYFVMCQCISTTVHADGAVQFTFFLVVKLNITNVTSYDSLIVILVF